MPSSVIRFYSYDADTRDLTVGFVSGRLYLYKNVPAEVAAALKEARSKGAFFNREIRDHYVYRNVTRDQAG